MSKASLVSLGGIAAVLAGILRGIASFIPLSEQTPVRAPTAYASFPKDILHPPRTWGEPVYPNIRRWTRMPAGGHFAALEEPQALAADIRAFFRGLR
jgi:pimeloyl-ACP methyl ester carboxylesterase